jgi:hypothetical protein
LRAVLAGRRFAVFLAGAFLAAVFFPAFLLVFLALPFLAADLVAFLVTFLVTFLVAFFVATARERDFAALFFLEPLPLLLRARVLFLPPFLAAIVLLLFSVVHRSLTVTNYLLAVHVYTPTAFACQMPARTLLKA